MIMNKPMKSLLHTVLLLAAVGVQTAIQAQEPRIVVQAGQVLHPISRHLTGACIEDVNHEIYGGIYSQMIFGESFQEPAVSMPPRGFKAYGGQWRVEGGELHFQGSQGDKLMSELAPFGDGEVGVEIFMADRNWSNVGLVTRMANAGPGTDHFDGYEIALNAAKQSLLLGRHRQNWEPIKETPCEVPVGQWLSLTVKMEGPVLEVLLNGKSIVRHEDDPQALLTGTVGLRAFQSEARYRNFRVKTGGETHPLAFVNETAELRDVSGMWRAMTRGSATGAWAIEKQQPFVGSQSQRLEFTGGAGEVGIENQGLNRWKMYFEGGKSYEGLLWVRSEKEADVWVALESADGAAVHAEKKLRIKSGDWQRVEFSLTPRSTEPQGRFAIKLKQPAAVTVGYAFLQPGEWGRFKGLPVRRDVAEGLINQGVTVLRYGGSMINHPEYRWKKMIGPRDQRAPNAGTWYAHSSNGWGILDFMDFCEAAGFEYVPAFNMGETPQDMADFIEYARGSADSQWGRRRVADGHPKPYRLKYIELGNEERVDEKYAATFEQLAKAIWARDPDLILVVGDFCYGEKIQDPYKFGGAAGGITSLAGQKRVLDLARQNNREVWFDIHVGTDGPRPDATFDGMWSFKAALDKIADGARHKVVVFEFNAGNHSQRRALANALGINAAERDGGLPIVTSANCLQPDGQNDNDWDQGLLFLNPSQVWLQPPGYVTRMISRNYQPLLVKSEVSGNSRNLDVIAKRSEDGRTLVMQVVNVGDQPQKAAFQLEGFTPSKPTARVEELCGSLQACNTALWPGRIISRETRWNHGCVNGNTSYLFPPQSFTVIVFE
jgi:hypothetical protein